LVVRQFEQPRNRDLALLLDLWQPPSPGAEHLDNVELAVSFAATVVADLCHKGGTNLSLATSGSPPQCIRGSTSAALLQEVMQRLAVVEAQSEDGLVDLLRHGLEGIEPGTETVLVSTRAVDLSDRARLATLWADPRRRALLQRIRVVDTSSDRLSEYFQPE
jgi:uncharacterized protein (DUF58 family)